MKRFFRGALLAAALWAGTTSLASAAPLFEPDGSWKTLQTAHFRIYYTAPFAQKARQIAAIAEDAHARLVPYMQVAPNGPTEVVLADGYDELNSMATDSPHRAVWLWMTPPNPDEGMWIGRYDQWMRLLFTHEYTHVLQFQDTPFWVSQANSALGGLLLSGLPTLPIDITLNLPDLLSNAPAFFTEGLAVHTESTFTPGGRGNEGDFEMLRRMAFLEHRVPTLDQVWGRYLLDWPMAGYEYTWGEPFVRYLTKTYGEDAPAKILKRFGVAPWLGFDVAVKGALGVDCAQIWQGMLNELQAHYDQQAAEHALRAKGFQAATSPAIWAHPDDVTTSGRYHRHPFWSPDGKTLYYTEAAKNQSPKLWAYDVAKKTRAVVCGKSTRSAASIDPSGRYVYMERDTQDTIKELSSFRDLFSYDRETKKYKRLTHGARTFAPQISPDGKRIVAVTSGAGLSGLAIFDQQGQQLHKWTFDNNDVQFGNPTWSPDGRLLAVSIWKAGTRDIWLVDPESGEQTELWKDAAVDFYPSWSPDGRYVLFTSDRSEGIFNVYAYHLGSRRLLQLTDVIGGAFDPMVSPDGKTLAFVNYTGRGYDVQTIPFDPDHSLNAPAPGAVPDVLPITPPLPTPQTKSPTPYNPLPTMLPSIWFPVLGQDEYGTSLSLYTYWQDILREHALTLIGGYGFYSQHLSYGLLYENNQSFPQWDLGINEYPEAGRYPVSNTQAGNLWQWDKSASVAINIPGLRNPMFNPPPISGDNWTIGARTEMIHDYAFQPDAQANQPAAPLQSVNSGHQPFPTAYDEGNDTSVFVQWQRATAVAAPYDYGPMSGQITSLGAEAGLQNSTVAGSPPAFGRAWADHRFYTKLPWGDKQSLAVRTTAGLLYGRDGDFYYSDWLQPFGYTPISTINRWDLTSASAYDTRYVMLRGYNFLLGNREAEIGLEYRFPIADIFRGVPYLPVFLDRWYGVAFWDNGFFWGLDPTVIDMPQWTDFKSGLGFELRAQTDMFGSVPVDVRFGLAYGLINGGSLQPNVGLGTTF